VSTASLETAKVRLVTIIAGEELLDGLERQLKAMGVPGYTVGRADGRGMHGPRRSSFVALANVRIEVLLPPAEALRLLERIAQEYAGRQVIAFAHDVEAIPKEHFV
jgi:hypothetical protein